MSTLTLVRHGQASFFAADYDKLSDVGETQARLLGSYWLGRGVSFDEVYTGPRSRQIETAALAGEAFARAGVPWPRPVVLAELDEHAVDRLIKGSLPEISQAFPHLVPLAEAYARAETDADTHRGFQKLFEAVMLLWATGDCGADGVETWRAFGKRVRSGLARITGGAGRGRRVVAFTSVGAITVALQAALGLGDPKALDLGWRLRNCSINEFLFTTDRLTLDGFNAFPHLADPSLWTYR
ncbi:MAG: histidine phosphatase family protein [Singulisphaera sp.]